MKRRGGSGNGAGGFAEKPLRNYQDSIVAFCSSFTKRRRSVNHQIIALEVVPFKAAGQPPYCQAGVYSGVASTIFVSVGS